MKDQKKTLHQIMEKFYGLNKREAYEITERLEVLFFYASSPIEASNIKKIMSSDFKTAEEIDPFHFTILPNKNFCEFLGSNEWLHIYKENKRFLSNWSILNTYYFKTKYAPLELLKLTKKNLLESIHQTNKEKEIREFLKKNNVTKKNKITDKLLILER